VLGRAVICVVFLTIVKFYHQVKQWQSGDAKLPEVLEMSLLMGDWVFAVPILLAALALGFRFSRKANRFVAGRLPWLGMLWFAWVMLCWELQAVPSR
jgi:small-conductance mechanosensitive channel